MPVQTTTVTGQQAIPEQLMPYFTGASGIPGLLPKAQEVFSKGYAEQYGDPLAAAGLAGSGRVAPMSAMQQQVGTQLSQMGTPTQFGMGMGTAGAGAGAIGMGLGTLGGMTDPNAVQQYMSPYIRNVLDVQKAEAIRDAEKGQLVQNLGAARQGTYGGARQLLAQSEATRNLQTKLGQIEAQGMQSAFDAAQKAQLAQAQQYGQYGQQLGRWATYIHVAVPHSKRLILTASKQWARTVTYNVLMSNNKLMLGTKTSLLGLDTHNNSLVVWLIFSVVCQFLKLVKQPQRQHLPQVLLVS